MWAQRDRSLGWSARLRAYVGRAAGAAVLVVAIGCSERRSPSESNPPAAATAPATAPAVSPHATLGSGAVATARLRKPLPAPVAMPGGGSRIDMRGTNWHVRALERQADGTLRHVCSDAPDVSSPGGAP